MAAPAVCARDIRRRTQFNPAQFACVETFLDGPHVDGAHDSTLSNVVNPLLERVVQHPPPTPSTPDRWPPFLLPSMYCLHQRHPPIKARVETFVEYLSERADLRL